MRGIAAISILVLLAAAWPATAQTQPQHTFPTKEQITLLVVQAERAFDVYANAVTLEAQLLGEIASGKEMVARDRQVLNSGREVIRILKQRPDAFNTPMGFLLVSDLDDASRNAALCAGQAASLAATDFMVGQTASAQEKLSLGEACTGASALLYTVSETAFHLYSEVLFTTDETLKRALEVATKCGEALKVLQSKQPAKKP